MEYYNDIHYDISPEIKFICKKNYIIKSLVSEIFEVLSQTHLEIYNNDIRNINNAWSDWFSGSPGQFFPYIYSSSITINQNTQVLFCIFLDINSSIILTSEADISLLVEECSFIDCYRNNNGGAIYIYDGSNCVLNKICAYQCNTTSGYNGQFCYNLVKSGSQYKNIAHLVSVCKCAQYENSARDCSICNKYGNMSLNNVNSSANRCKHYSGVFLYGPSISYTAQSTFSNNSADNWMCIRLWSNSYHMSQCNIIKNHQMPADHGIIDNYNAVTSFSGCIIDMNTGATNIIRVWSGSVNLQNCYLQTNIQKIGSVNTQSPLSDSHSLILSHFDDHMCLTLMQNVIDNVNTMTSNIKCLIDTNMFTIHIILTLLLIVSI